MFLVMAGMMVHTNSLIKKYEDQNHICWSHSKSDSEEKSKSKDLPGKSNANLLNRVGESLSNISSCLEVSIELLDLMM
jgi:hypothetical protein